MAKSKKMFGLLAGGAAVAVIAVGLIAGPASAAKPASNFDGTFIKPSFTATVGERMDVPMTWQVHSNYMNNKKFDITLLSPTSLAITGAPAYFQESADGVNWTNSNVAVKCSPKGKADTMRMKCTGKPAARTQWNWTAGSFVRLMVPMEVKESAAPGNTVQAGIAQMKFSSSTPKTTKIYLPIDTNAAYRDITIVR